MREELRTEESSEEEEDAYEEHVREPELVRPQAPISFHRFRFHIFFFFGFCRVLSPLFACSEA